MWKCLVCGYVCETVTDDNFNDHPGHPDDTDWYDTEWKSISDPPAKDQP